MEGDGGGVAIASSESLKGVRFCHEITIRVFSKIRPNELKRALRHKRKTFVKRGISHFQEEGNKSVATEEG